MTFDEVANEITKVDVGGAAKQQLNITEARQALASVLKVFANKLTLKEIAVLVAEYVTIENGGLTW